MVRMRLRTSEDTGGAAISLATLPSPAEPKSLAVPGKELYRRQLSDEKTRRKLQRLDKRLLTVASQLQRIYTSIQRKNEERLAS